MPSDENDFQLENYCSAMPVFVQEALASFQTDDSAAGRSTASFNFDASNRFCWLVAGRKAYLWNFKSAKMLCHILPLPQSGLKFHADLFTIFDTKTTKTNAHGCLCVSPEGVLRVWRKPDCPNDYVDIAVDLGGQVAQIVKKLPNSRGYILATSTCNLFVVKPTSDYGQPFSIVAIKVGQGAVASISRRVTSLLFATPNIPTDNQLRGFSVCPLSNESSLIAVLTEKSIHCWLIQGSSFEYQFLWDLDATKCILDQAIRQIWHLKSVRAISQFRPSLEYNFLDIQFYDNALYVVVALVNRGLSSEIYYSVCSFTDLHTQCVPEKTSTFLCLKNVNGHASLSDEFTVPRYKMRHMHGSSDSFLISEKKIVKFGQDGECSAFNVDGTDKIIGSGSYATHVLVFTISSGLVRLKVGEKPAYSVFVEEMSILHQLEQSLSEVDCTNTNLRTDRTDEVELAYGQFKKAFLSYLKQNLHESQSILIDLFGDLHQIPSLIDRADLSASSKKKRRCRDGFKLNDLVLKFGTNIVDDYPAADSRWIKTISSNTSGIGVTSSLLIYYQLEDKKKTFDVFCEFLKRMGLWNKLSLVNHRQDNGELWKVHCQLVLSEYREKLDACSALIDKDWSKIQPLLNQAMRRVLKQRNESVSGELTLQDHFFRRVSQCDAIIPALVHEQDAQISSAKKCDGQFSDVDLICSVNHFILEFLNAASSCRSKLAPHRYPSLEAYLLLSDDSDIGAGAAGCSTEELFGGVNFVAYWTSRDRPADQRRSMKRALDDQWRLAVDFLRPGVASAEATKLAQQLAQLSHHLLRDAQLVRMYWAEKRSGEKLARDKLDEYINYRRKLIEPLLSAQQYDQAALLAENFEDFDILIRLCEICDDDSLLEKYRQKFAAQNFDHALDSWYLREKKYERLFEQNTEQLAKFLSNNQRNDLLWLYFVKNGAYSKVSHCLKEKAIEEDQFLSRKKTLLSLSKLACLCSDSPADGQLAGVNKEIDIVTIQEQAPDTALKNFGLDKDNMRPLKIRELIEVYSMDPCADEFSFLKAIELLRSHLYECVNDQEFEKVKTRLWARAILQDDWVNVLASNDPLKSSKSTIFAKTLEFLLSSLTTNLLSADYLKVVLPAADLLLECEELELLNASETFQYILKAGQEAINLTLCRFDNN